MNIVINAVLSFKEPRGVGRYINNLLPALAEIDNENEYFIYYGEWMTEYSFLKIGQKNFHFIKLKLRNTQLARNFYLAVMLPIICRKYNPDVLFLIDTQALLFKPCRLVSTVHDLAEFVVPEKYPPRQAFLRRCIVRWQTKLSDEILTVSNYSKQDICKRFGINPDKVFVTYNSVELPKQPEEQLIPEHYFLFVSETEKAKNLAELIEAFDLLDTETKNRFSIRVVGKEGNDHQHILEMIKEKGICDKVTFYGYVSDAKLNDLYRRAYAFVFPSMFEGFGLPVLEAMAQGVPVLCSNTSSIPEVGGSAVLTFSPYHASELAAQLTKIIQDAHLRTQMIQEGFSRAQLFTKRNSAISTLKVLVKG